MSHAARAPAREHTFGSQRRRHALGVRLADAAARPAVDADAGDVVSLADVGRAWRRLSGRHQEALALAVVEELSAPRAAAVLGISPVAFRLRLSRARRALRLHLDPCRLLPTAHPA